LLFAHCGCYDVNPLWARAVVSVIFVWLCL
jgi:hypothetical protein